MTAARRMQVLEQRAAAILLERGYTPFIVSHFVRSSRYIAFNLTARKDCGADPGETVMVKLKPVLHPIRSQAGAEAFCRDEIAMVRKFLERLPPGGDRLLFEIWLALPQDGFQQFSITESGIRELALPETVIVTGERAYGIP